MSPSSSLRIFGAPSPRDHHRHLDDSSSSQSSTPTPTTIRSPGAAQDHPESCSGKGGRWSLIKDRIRLVLRILLGSTACASRLAKSLTTTIRPVLASYRREGKGGAERLAAIVVAGPQQPPPSSRPLSTTTRTSQRTAASKATSAKHKPKETIMIPRSLLRKQNAETSNALLEHYKDSPSFAKLAKFEGDLTVRRDQEDADKLQKGIDYAKSKGVIDPNYVPEPYTTVDVLGKSPDQVASAILESCGESDLHHGTVIVLVGLSGTGKGTTVSRLQSSLEERGKSVVCWSNGNIFRSVTLLAVTWCDQNNGGEFDAAKACTAENLRHFMSMLSFGKGSSASSFDTRILGMGLDYQVSQIQNTVLKTPAVASNIPAVAEYTQGEVILFAASAVKTLCDSGITVLLEGREQTVNYVRTPHRFSLVLSDESLIGKRRAAQRIMAAALERASPFDPEEGKDEDLTAVVDRTLEEMVQEL